MSLDATVWAWKKKFTQAKGGSSPALKKLVLLSMADRADEQHCCYPSSTRLAEDCQINKKTLFKILDELSSEGLIFDTGERKGRTKQVIVYRLIGVQGRENTVPTLEQLGSESLDTQGEDSQTVPTMEQFQHFQQTVPTIPPNSTNVGTRNLPKNLSDESKNKKTWLSLKKLREEILLSDKSVDFDQLVMESWYHRELRAFELNNASKNLCDDLLIFHFADWLLNAKAKYERRQKASQPTKSFSGEQNNSTGLSQKQIAVFADKLSKHPEFSSKYAEGNESYEQLAARVAVKLTDPEQLQKLMPYLIQVGFTAKGAA
ncbi:helix-turn-helix domain-containing protein [Acinetobacter baumannii]|nr:helix-turn-helix domain-containing protein [Acinetobacter baumannii]